MEQTINNHSTELSTLKKTLDVLKDFFMSGAIEIDPHILQVSRGRYTSKRKLSDEAKRALELANEENTLLETTMNLWFELGEAFRNLIIGNYGSVHRSLRWIVESAVFWMYLQIDKEEDARELFEGYCEESMVVIDLNILENTYST
jgi:hypothetical protein